MAGRVSRRTLLAALMVLAWALPLVAQEDRFESKQAFALDKPMLLDGKAGPVKVTTLKITDLGLGYKSSGINITRTIAPPSELSTTLRFAMDVNNPTHEEWQVTFTIELLDKSGKVIERVTKKENYDNEMDRLVIEHPLLQYVMPLISDVKVTLAGKKK
jgi:hypothetical protein